jgi:hypothetical protein
MYPYPLSPRQENKDTMKPLHVCPCDACRQDSRGTTAELHRAINHVVAALDEKSRRRFVGLWASQLGHGGIQNMVLVTGLDRATIRRGCRELAKLDDIPDTRIRAPGGGRKLTEKKRRNSCSSWTN